jgi:hypothetical protein
MFRVPASRFSSLLPTSLRYPCFRRQIALSAVEGAREPLLDNRTLPGYFSAEVLSQRPNHLALICRQERPRAHGGPLSRNMGAEGHLAWDFNEFDSHIRALARGLVGLSVNKGDRVGVIMGNTRYVFSYCIVAMGPMLTFLQARMRCCNGHVQASEQSLSP